MPRAVIITSWMEYDLDIRPLLRKDDHVVCLDRGFEIAESQGIRPDLLLGDFDSTDRPLPENSGIRIMRFPPEKDYTDLELAFRILDPEIYPDLLVLGGLGGRLDHTIANIQMLYTYTAKAKDPVRDLSSVNEDHHRFDRIIIRDGRNLCFALRADPSADEEPVRLTLSADLMEMNGGCYFSLFPLAGDCSGVTVRNAKYPLTEAVLPRGFSLGTSNEFLDGPAEISLREGSLLVILSLKEE